MESSQIGSGNVSHSHNGDENAVLLYYRGMFSFRKISVPGFGIFSLWLFVEHKFCFFYKIRGKLIFFENLKNIRIFRNYIACV